MMPTEQTERNTDHTILRGGTFDGEAVPANSPNMIERWTERTYRWVPGVIAVAHQYERQTNGEYKFARVVYRLKRGEQLSEFVRWHVIGSVGAIYVYEYGPKREVSQ